MSYDSRPETYEHIDEVRKVLGGAIADLRHRSDQHDQSKLRPPEVEMFDEYTPKLRELEYGSEEYEATREAMGPALKHHYDHNDHHPEHFPNGVEDMDLMQITEMLCDWIAAGRRHADGGDIHRSIEQNAERFGYGDELRKILHTTADRLLFLEPK
jgi:hypothetical protein